MLSIWPVLLKKESFQATLGPGFLLKKKVFRLRLARSWPVFLKKAAFRLRLARSWPVFLKKACHAKQLACFFKKKVFMLSIWPVLLKKKKVFMLSWPWFFC
jgi:hypothetical protein